MNWEIIELKNEQKGSGSPYASVGNGRINLSAAATKLIDNSEKYVYANFLKGKINGKICIGIKLLLETERNQNSLPIKRKHQKGKLISGMEISNKSLMEELFGPAGSARKTTRYNVQLDNDDDTVLVVFMD